MREPMAGHERTLSIIVIICIVKIVVIIGGVLRTHRVLQILKVRVKILG